MASPERHNSAPGKWTFVNRQGEEENVEDDTSSTSSSSSSEFVKVDRDTVSYHHKASNTSDVSSLSDDEKTCWPVSTTSYHTDVGGSGETGVPEVRQGASAWDMSRAYMLEEECTTGGQMSNLFPGAKLLSSEEESDVEIVTEDPSEGVAGTASVEKCSEDGEVTEEHATPPQPHVHMAVPAAVCHTPLLLSTCFSQPDTQLSSPSSEDLPQFRLVLRPSSACVTDSDSDFSHLDSHSSTDQSESEELSDPTAVNSGSRVHSVFCFSHHRYVADIGDGHGPVLQLAEVVGQEHVGRTNPHLNSAANRAQNDANNESDHEHYDVVVHDQAGVQYHSANEEAGNNGFHVIDDNVSNTDSNGGDINQEVDDDVNTGTESGVEDERIESDQSDGIPADEDDDDLSFSNIGLENLSLHEVNLTRQYIHQPNKYLSSTLSLLVIMAGWMALGLAIGHSLGSSKQNMQVYHSLHRVPNALISRLHQTQDNLFMCLHRDRDRFSTMEKESHECNYQKAELTRRLETQGEAISLLRREVKNWKVKVNELQQVKVDLESEIIRLKYQKHPGNTENSTEHKVIRDDTIPDVVHDSQSVALKPETQVKHTVNSDGPTSQLGTTALAGDGEDKSNVPMHKGNSPETPLYQEELSSVCMLAEEWKNRTAKLKQELSQAQGRAAMWQQLYLTERHRKPAMVNTTPSVFSCISMLTPAFNFSEVIQALNNSVVKSYMEFPDMSLVKSYIDDSFERKKIFSTIAEFQALFTELSKLWMKWSSTPDERDFEKEATRKRKNQREKWVKEEGEDKQLTWSENLKQLLNETQKSVAKVSLEIQQKWMQIKNLSEHLWKKHQPTISNWQEILGRQISDIGEKIREKLDKKSSCWFKRKRKQAKAPKHFSSSKNDPQHHKKIKGKTHKNRHNRSTEKADKRLIKSQQRIQRKAFKKLLKKIKRLNWRSYKHQGVDGLRRMMTEIDNFRISHSYPDENIQLWVNCQLKWWESRLQMEKFVYAGCGKALFKWQVKVEKMDAKQKKEERWGKNNQNDSRKRHHNKNSGSNKRQQHKEGKNTAGHGKWREDDKDGRFDGPKPSSRQEQQPRRQNTNKSKHSQRAWQGSQTPNVTGGKYPTKSGDWYFKRQRDRGQLDKDSWYVRKMEHKQRQRESYPDGTWVFDRADHRDFHRKRPDSWYFRRAERWKRKNGLGDNSADWFVRTSDEADESYECYNSYGFTVCY